MVSLGHVEGRNIVYDVRAAGREPERLSQLARELITGKPSVIVSATTPAARALSEATRDIPIVLALIGDPMALGLTQNLARPTRNMTGNTSFTFSSHGVKTDPTMAALPVDQTARSRYDIVPEGYHDLWSVAFAYSYSGGYPGTSSTWSSQQTGNIVTHYQVSPAWTVDFSASYDITAHRLLTHRFAITRDLHCWVASFTRDFNPGGRAEYYCKISIKDQRELYMEHGSRTSSLGGIQ